MTFVWSRNTVRESSHISFFFCGGGHFLWSSATAGEHARGSRQVCLSDQRTSPFAWVTSGSLLSAPNYRLYILSQVPSGNMNILFVTCISFLWLVIGTYILPFFLPVICWSYLRTEISVTLSIGNKLYSHLLSFFLSSETTLLMLSCDLIEPAKFIHSTLSLSKLVYYIGIHFFYGLIILLFSRNVFFSFYVWMLYN